MYRLEITTSHSENWRYNIMVTLSMRDSAGEQCGYHTVEDSPFEVGTNSENPPEEFVRRREISLDFEKCSSVRFIIYMLPNSLPQIKSLEGADISFPIQIKIVNGENKVFAEKIEVNRFGGCGVERIVELE